MRLEWRDSMSVGNAVLDFQHRHLLYLLDGFRMSLEDNNLEAAQLSILEFKELSEMHIQEEQKYIPENDLYSKAKHADAHTNASRLIEELRRQVCDQMEVSGVLSKLNSTLTTIVIDLFSFDRDIRRSISEPERRKSPRLTGGGFVADIAGNIADVIDISPESITLRTDAKVPEELMAIGLVPRIRATLLESEQVVIFGKANRLDENTLSLKLSSDSKQLVAALVHKLFMKMQAVPQIVPVPHRKERMLESL